MWNTDQLRRKLSLLASAALLLTAPVSAQPLSGRDIVERVENLLWSKTLQGRFEMTIATPRWRRTLSLQVWIERPQRSFIRILAPAKEAGIGSLRIGAEMWNYVPKIERTIKIPPSMMLQPWMGSDFTNDDLVKESSFVDDYTHRVAGTETIDGAPAYVVEAQPKPEAAVVWGRVIYRVRQADLMPLSQQFFDERGVRVRVLSFSDIKAIGGRRLPTRWEMRQQDKPGQSTTVVLTEAVYDRAFDPAIFTLAHLEKR